MMDKNQFIKSVSNYLKEEGYADISIQEKEGKYEIQYKLSPKQGALAGSVDDKTHSLPRRIVLIEDVSNINSITMAAREDLLNNYSSMFEHLKGLLKRERPTTIELKRNAIDTRNHPLTSSTSEVEFLRNTGHIKVEWSMSALNVSYRVMETRGFSSPYSENFFSKIINGVISKTATLVANLLNTIGLNTTQTPNQSFSSSTTLNTGAAAQNVDRHQPLVNQEAVGNSSSIKLDINDGRRTEESKKSR